jgi:pyruvate carboxylase
VRILVIDHGWAHASYFCTALAACGNEVVLATTHRPNGLGLGRGVRLVQIEALAVHEIDRVIREHPADVVYLMTEQLMELAQGLPNDTAQQIFPQLNEFQRRHIEDRRELYGLLRQSGVVFPEIVNVESEHDVERAVHQFGFPLVVRGISGNAGVQVVIVREPGALTSAVQRIREASPEGLFLQRFVAGRRCIVGALCIDGAAKQIICQRVLDTFPEDTSPSILNRSFYSASIVDSASTVFALLNWTGFGSADFIEDEQGRFHFLEFNPRLWGSVQVAEICGVPMIDAFSRLINGRDQQSQRSGTLDRTVALFPQYIAARLAQRRLLRLREILPVLRCIVDAPPGLPNFLLHNTRRAIARLRRSLVARVASEKPTITANSKAAPRRN